MSELSEPAPTRREAKLRAREAKAARGAGRRSTADAAAASAAAAVPPVGTDISPHMLEQRLARIEQAVTELARDSRAMEQASREILALGLPLVSVRRSLQSILRAFYLKPEELDYPYRLTVQRFGLMSQFEEDGLTLAILREAGFATSRFVEIGCGDNGGNSGFLAQELGWSGLMIDADEGRVAASRHQFPQRVDVSRAWVTSDSINALLVEHGMTGEIDLLSIDIDGNDYWIWEAIDVVDPRLVIVEANVLFGDERAVVVPYDPGFDRHDYKSTYFGASLAALAALADRKRYRLVAMEPSGPNAFFLRDDVAPQIPRCEPADVHRHLEEVIVRRQIRRGQVGDPVAELYAYIDRQGLPLVEVEPPTSAP